MQTVLPLTLHSLTGDEVSELTPEFEQLAKLSNDLYWNRALFFLDSQNKNNLIFTDHQEIYNEIADLFLEGEYSKVARLSATYLKNYPEIQELHSYFIKSIIFTSEEVSDYFDETNVLTQLLTLMKAMLIKGEKYSTTRDKLVSSYYRNSFFKFSNCLLEDLYYEYQFTTPTPVGTKVFLNSNIISLRSLKSLGGKRYSELPCIFQSNWDILIRDILNDRKVNLDFSKFHQVELYVMTKISIGSYEPALECLNEFHLFNEGLKLPEFVQTWFIKCKILCLVKLSLIGEAVNLIVQQYLKSNIFYDHYYFQDITDYLIENDDSPVYKEISVPIFFQITKQSKTLCYDSIANFLFAHDYYRPSEMVNKLIEIETRSVIYFLEKCCIKSHIEDSPFINSIEALSSERISILNCLKQVNPDKLEKYNEEILSITKEETIRKGVKHIHESRIFVDTDSLIKIVNSDMKDGFERYLSIDNQRYSALSAMTIEEAFDPDRVDSMFHCLEPVDSTMLSIYMFGEPWNDPNIVRVPFIRYSNYKLLFDQIKQEFIFNEDFGFKSFLSMRIRHGTFENVLRSVFDKFHLISSKESSGDEYKEINYWKDEMRCPRKFEIQFQEIFKSSSRSIDDLIELGLSWIKISEHKDENNAIFDFTFSEDEMRANFINRVGRIKNSDEFIQEVYDILYDKLDVQLKTIRQKISSELSPRFVEIIEQMEADISSIYSNNNQTTKLQEQIIACKTEIQLVTNQVRKWFKISQTPYVDELPMEMILEASIDYMNSINGQLLSTENIERNIQCQSKYKGKYFEGFGDMLINIFDNIIKNNKDLRDELRINVLVESKNGSTKIVVSNNLSPKIDKEVLKLKIEDIKRKVKNYRQGNLANSFEDGSGYLKICRCISADLEQTNYEVDVAYVDDKYEVQILIENKMLVV